jgi:subtilisin family serine protease
MHKKRLLVLTASLIALAAAWWMARPYPTLPTVALRAAPSQQAPLSATQPPLQQSALEQGAKQQQEPTAQLAVADVRPMAERPGPAAAKPAAISQSPTGKKEQRSTHLQRPVGMLARFPRAVIVDQRSVALPSGLMRRETLIRTESKYPLVKMEEVVQPAKGADKPEATVSELAMVADHVITRPQEGITDAEFRAEVKAQGGEVRRFLPLSGNYLVSFPQPSLDGVSAATAALTGKKASFVEPDYIVFATATPNDSRYSELWGMHNLGQSAGLADADIDAPEAWNLSTGSRSVVVGVIDSGVDHNHPDLVANMWTNPGEIAGNGADDDGNGYIDDTRGWDFANDDNNPMDDNNHGTHCAGTIGGVGNDGQGVVGVCWQVSLVGLKFLSASGSGSTSDAVEAVAYATNKGMTLTSNSWGGGGFSTALNNVISAANAAGIPFIAAAGNSATDNDSVPHYPSSYDQPNVIAVASTTRTDQMSSFSCFGLRSVDIAAPGSEILSAVPGGLYSSFNGTSMATPHVAGAMALLKAYRPALNAADLRDIILASADPLPSLAGRIATGGRLNVHQAMLAADSMTVTLGNFTATGNAGGPFLPTTQSYTIKNRTAASISWAATTSAGWVSLSQTSGTLATGASVTVVASIHPSAAGYADGVYPATLTFRNVTANTSTNRPARLNVGLSDYFTEIFDAGSPNDLDNSTLVFQPSTTRSRYLATKTSATAFPTNPTGGTPATLTDDSVVTVSLTTPVILYGQSYSTAHICSNGFLTFTTADSGYTTSLAHHFDRPRISALLSDLLPTSGQVTYKQLSDRFAVTWIGVSDYAVTNSNSFQIEMFHSGMIRITWLGIASTGGVAGISAGGGVPSDFIESNLSSYLAIAGSLVVPQSVAESAGVLTNQGRITLLQPASAAQTFLLSSSNTSIATVPASVTLPVGASQAQFNITVLNNSGLNGSRPVTISAALTVGALTSTMVVHDDETSSLTLTGPATALESAGILNGSVSLSSAPTSAVTVQLSSSDTSEVKVPSSVVIPAGQTSAVVPFIIEDDTELDGTESATITASVTGWTPGTHSIQVQNNDVASLTLTLPVSATESVGTVNGTITLGGSINTNAQVTLSSDSARVLAPTQVTVPSGARSASFSLRVVNDQVIGADFSALIQASLPGFSPDSKSLQIIDDDPSSLSIAPIVGIETNASFIVTATARNAAGQIKGNFNSPATVTATLDGVPVPVLVGSASFVNGICSATLYVDDPGELIVTISVAGGLSATATTSVVDNILDFYTEVVDEGDLDFKKWTFVPYGNSYRVRKDAVTTLPTDPYYRHPNLFEIVDDDSVFLPLSGGKTVKLFGVSYSGVYVSDNGCLTFTGPSTIAGGITTHFWMPRVSAALMDLIAEGGYVAAYQEADRYVVSWVDMSFFNSRQDRVTMQVEMFFNGMITITHLNVMPNSFVVGLSPGGGSPAAFVETDFNAYPGPALSLDVPSFGQEGAATSLEGSVNIGHSAGGVVTLSGLPTTDLLLPPTVTVPVGRNNAKFSFTVREDTLLEHDEPVAVKGAYGRLTATDTITVLDNESATLSISPIPDVSEGSPPFYITINSDSAAARPVTVSLNSSDSSVVTLPSSVILPAGKRSVVAKATLAEDEIDNRTRNITLTASVTGWTSGSNTVWVGDNDASRIIVDAPATTVPEGAGTFPITLRITSRTGSATTLALSTDSPTRLSLPPSIIVPANQLSVTVDALVLDNATAEGDSRVLINASAPGHQDGSTSLVLGDDDAAALSFDSILVPQRAHVSFPIIIRAVDAQGHTLTGVNGSFTLEAAAGGNPFPLQLQGTPTFVNGVATVIVAASSSATALSLTATLGTVVSTSTTFDVSPAARDFYTENFTPTEVRDFQYSTILFTPQTGLGAGKEYWVERAPITALPTNPVGGTPLTVVNDGTVPVTLTDGKQVVLYGQSYSTLYINENGNITTEPDVTQGGSEANHFFRPRVSALYSNLKSGACTYRQHSDRITVTWTNFLATQPAGAKNTFQAELYFDGRIRLSYLNTGQSSCIIGLSGGGGSLPINYVESDFSSYPLRASIVRQPASLTVKVGTPAQLSVLATGTGLSYQWRKNGINVAGATSDKLNIPLAQTSDAGRYDVLISTAQRTEVSAAATLTVVSPVSIAEQPSSQVVALGAPSLLRVRTADTTGLSYQWLKNGVALLGANSPVYSLSTVQPIHAATYTVKVTNAHGSIISAPATIGVLTIANTNLIQNVGTTMLLSVPAVGPGLSYVWEKDGTPVTDDLRIKGSRSARLSVARFADADAAAYSCVVTASSSGSNLESGNQTVRIRHVPIIDPWSPGPWIVSGTVNETFTASREPVLYKVTGLPSGVTQVPGQNRLIGKPNIPGNYTLRISSSNSAGAGPSLDVPVTVIPLQAYAIGYFEGLILPSGPAATRNQNGGTLRFSVSNTGALTGTLLLDGVSTRLTGRVDSSVSAAPTINYLQAGVTGFSWTGSLAADGHHTGSITRGADVAAADAWITGSPLPATYAGLYNAGITLDPSLLGDITYPQGSSHLAITITPAGAVSWTGKLADSSATTGSSKLGASLRIPFHQQLYGTAANAGAMNGWLQLSTDGSGNKVDSMDLKWRKPLQTAFTRSYRSGFPQHSQTLAGRLYAASNPVLSLSTASPNASLTFSQGKIGLNALSSGGILLQNMIITPDTLAAVTSGSSLAVVTLKLTPATGAISGTFTFRDSNPLLPAQIITRTVAYSGLLIPGTNGGLGHFQLPELPSASPATTVTTAPMWSGKVELRALP